jgi:Pyridoxine 5'-phosphate oxidase C-terminal dimerisation region
LARAGGPQSAEVANRAALDAALAGAERQFAGVDQIPVPGHWGGWRIRPHSVEFWQGRPYRMHDRLVFDRIDGEWRLRRLAPCISCRLTSPRRPLWADIGHRAHPAHPGHSVRDHWAERPCAPCSGEPSVRRISRGGTPYSRWLHAPQSETARLEAAPAVRGLVWRCRKGLAEEPPDGSFGKEGLG